MMALNVFQPPLLGYAPPPARRWRTVAAGCLRAPGTWALGDQAVVSAGNFLTSILLARYWADRPEWYGVYALCFSVVLFLNNLHASLVVYPLTLTGATADPKGLPALAGRALGLTACLAPLLAVGAAAAAGLLGAWSAVPWVVAALVLWQGQETARRALLARLQHARAAAGDAIRYLAPAAAVWALHHAGRLTVESAFAAIAVASLLGGALQAWQVGASPPAAADLRPAAADAWRVGRWPLVTQLVNLGFVYVTPWVVTACHGPGTMAQFTALVTILGMTNPVVISMAGLIVPAVAAARAEGGMPAARRAALRYAGQAAVLLLPFYAVLIAAPAFALRVFFGAGSPFVALGAQLRVVAVGYALAFVGQVISALLNGLGETRATFAATVAAAVSNVLLAVPLVYMFGLNGAVWSGIAPIVIQGVVGWTLLRRVERQAGDWREGAGREDIVGLRPAEVTS